MSPLRVWPLSWSSSGQWHLTENQWRPTFDINCPLYVVEHYPSILDTLGTQKLVLTREVFVFQGGWMKCFTVKVPTSQEFGMEMFYCMYISGSTAEVPALEGH